jgi:hypothetical protein
MLYIMESVRFHHGLTQTNQRTIESVSTNAPLKVYINLYK